ncbi:GNAT family N-acetyltransferase [Acidisoma cladoniae]|jgi:ribosomal-protein-alanine N-acetyltransferase|uniref:GNAT family N-acetyltransferase n=1 Tax=Acidisoma cladoniae TaxID=3040935 RepID=UPI002549CA20|nr:GNAT family N-acetyltransferase [Acidisoma sp. PAMC 29798]
MSVLRVGPQYATVFASIHANAFALKEAWSVGAFQVQLEMHGVIGLLEPRGGLALIRVTADEAELLTIAVTRSARRQGLGRALLTEAMRIASGLGAAAMFLEVGFRNAAARALYAEMGFVQVGNRRGYYANGEDALVLRAPLSGALAPVATS